MAHTVQYWCASYAVFSMPFVVVFFYSYGIERSVCRQESGTKISHFGHFIGFVYCPDVDGHAQSAGLFHPFRMLAKFINVIVYACTSYLLAFGGRYASCQCGHLCLRVFGCYLSAGIVTERDVFHLFLHSGLPYSFYGCCGCGFIACDVTMIFYFFMSFVGLSLSFRMSRNSVSSGIFSPLASVSIRHESAGVFIMTWPLNSLS